MRRTIIFLVLALIQYVAFVAHGRTNMGEYLGHIGGIGFGLMVHWFSQKVSPVKEQ